MKTLIRSIVVLLAVVSSAAVSYTYSTNQANLKRFNSTTELTDWVEERIKNDSPIVDLSFHTTESGEILAFLTPAAKFTRVSSSPMAPKIEQRMHWLLNNLDGMKNWGQRDFPQASSGRLYVTETSSGEIAIYLATSRVSSEKFNTMLDVEEPLP